MTNSASMKRTQDMNLGHYRKKSPVFYLAPIAIAVGAALIWYYNSNDDVEATIYQNAQECIAANPGLVNACNASYASSLQEAERTAPKYASQADCEAEFGVGACNTPAQQSNASSSQYHGSGSYWIPLMAGYMMGRMSGGAYANSPMFSSTNARSPAYNKFVDATGRTYGSTTGSRNVKVAGSAFSPKPTTTQTITRGGFGQSVARMNAAQASKSSASRSSSSSSRSYGG